MGKRKAEVERDAKRKVGRALGQPKKNGPRGLEGRKSPFLFSKPFINYKIFLIQIKFEF
jgi:hypothetical protein